MSYAYYQPNPMGKSVGDCTVRALSKALGQTWEETYAGLALEGFMRGDLPNADSVWGPYLKAHGFSRHWIPDNCPDCYTVSQFAEDHPEGTFILSMPGAARGGRCRRAVLGFLEQRRRSPPILLDKGALTMGYQPYPYGGYQPAPYYPGPAPDQLAQLRQNQMQQPMMQGVQMVSNPPAVQQQNVLQSQQNSGMIWVSGKFDADNYLVSPNSAVALWDANNPVVYLRKADSTGKPSTVVCDLVERTDNPTTQSTSPVDLSRYVTIDQLEEILEERLKRPSKTTKAKEDR